MGLHTKRPGGAMLPSRFVLRRRATLGLGALTMLAGWMPGPAGAQSEYPSRPITLVVPFPAGGSTDLVARLVAAGMVKSLGQQIVVENRGGAGGNIGSAAHWTGGARAPRSPHA